MLACGARRAIGGCRVWRSAGHRNSPAIAHAAVCNALTYGQNQIVGQWFEIARLAGHLQLATQLGIGRIRKVNHKERIGLASG